MRRFVAVESLAPWKRPRTALLWAPALAFALALPAPAQAAPGSRHQRQAAPQLAVEVAGSSSGRAIPTSFLGISLEHPDLPSYAGPPGRGNPALVRLLNTLGSFGNGPITLRIGGRSTDQSWWNPTHAPRPAGVLGDVDGDWIARLGMLVRQTGARVVLGLNLGINDPANARELARAAIAGLPSGTISSLEIGNEPDLFTKPRVFHVGKRILRRERHRRSYDFDSYTRELDPYLVAMSSLGLRLSAGGFAGRDWTVRTRELLARTRRRIGELGVHSYPLQTCDGGRKRRATRLIAKLLRTRRSIKRISRLHRTAASQGVALRVSETNSAVCGGVGRVSNSFASALWGTDALFGYARAGAIGANLHTWNGAWYAPVEFRRKGSQRTAFVRPLFYGMLMFAKATANRARMVPASWHGHSRVRVWATRDSAGRIRVVALNVHRRLGRRVRLRVAGRTGPARLERLTAPSLGARRDVRLAGRTYGSSSLDGRMRGRLANTAVRRRAGRYLFKLPPASGALVTIGPR